MEEQRSPMTVNLRHDWKIHSTNSDLVRAGKKKKSKMKLQQDRKDNKNNASL